MPCTPEQVAAIVQHRARLMEQPASRHSVVVIVVVVPVVMMVEMRIVTMRMIIRPVPGRRGRLRRRVGATGRGRRSVIVVHGQISAGAAAIPD